MKRFLIMLILLVGGATTSFAQCNGVFPNNTVCGNITGSPNIPGPTSPSAFQGAAGGTNNQIQYNNSGALGGLTDAQVTARINGNSVLYTPQGSGAVASTIGAQLNRTIWVNNYGAVCDGATDDHAAFQAAINQGQSSGFPVRFSGNCKITTQISITAGLDFGGAGAADSLISVASGVSAILVNTTSPVFLHDFGINYASSAPSDTAISVTAGTENSDSFFSNLSISGAYIGMTLDRASHWVLSNSIIRVGIANGYGIVIANLNNVDSGDSSITGNTIICNGSFTCGAGILWTSSGGLRINNNKILGLGGATTGWTDGILFSLASGASTGVIPIIGNSIEGILDTGNGIRFVRAGATGILINTIISNNELSVGKQCVNGPLDANGAWLFYMTITGNVCALSNVTATTAYNFGNTVSGLVISNNVTVAGGGGTNTNISLGTQTATNCVAGPIPKVGTFGANTLSSCTSVSPN